MIAGERAQEAARGFPSRDLVERLASSVTSGGREASVGVHDVPEGRVVLKQWRPRTRLLRWYSSWILGREMRHYGLLSGFPGIPRFVARIDATRFLIEYVDAEPIHRGLEKDVLHAALDNLEAVIAGLHARGFAHLDLRHKGNILVGAGGRVWVIDLGQGLDCSKGFVRRLVFPLLRRIDRSAVTKFRARYAPETLPAARREKLERAYATRGVSWMPAFGRLLLRLMAWTPRHRSEKQSGPGPGLS